MFSRNSEFGIWNLECVTRVDRLVREFHILNSTFQIQSAAVSTIGDGLRIILCRSAPAGTIGYTESSCSTWKSINAARFRRRAASTAPSASARLVTVVAAIPNASASFAKFGPLIGVAAYRLS